MRLRWWLGMVLTAAWSPCAAATPLESCIRERLPAVRAPEDLLVRLDQVRAVCNNIATDEARLAVLRTNAKIYANQLTENNILLFVVVMITLAGLVLSALQLWASYKLAVAGHGELAGGGDINITTSNVAVKSSVVGVVILGISLAFFTLFILYVYQIKPLPPALSGPGASLPAAVEGPPPEMVEVPK